MIISYDKFKEKQKDLKEYEESIKKLIDEFISYNPAFVEKYKLKRYKKCHIFYENLQRSKIHPVHNQYRFNIAFNTDTRGEVGLATLEPEDFEKLKEFIKNPEIYRASNKYNL